MHRLKNSVAALLLCAGSAAFADDSGQFTLSTPIAFNQGHLPAIYTCDGDKISPKLIWLGAPAKTAAFALIVADPDAPNGTFYHWVLYNIPPDVSHLDKGATTLPPGTLVGTNSTNRADYFSPCPPQGPQHHYVFTVYALDKKLDLAAGADGKTVENAIQGHILRQADMTVLYGR